MGIEFRMGAELGVDLDLNGLEAEYAAIFVATGAGRERPVGIRGESLLEAGLAFLEATKRGDATLPGARCAVIGGGNTAIDVARVLRRMGGEVTVLYRRTAAEMPAIAEEYHRAAADGVQFEWLSQPRSVTKQETQLVVLVETMRLGDPDASGRRSPQPTGHVRQLRFDSVFAATGEAADVTPFPPALHDDSGWLAVGEDGATPDPSVFAGGDLATGPATVIEAIVAGRRAARAIDHKLGFADRWPADEVMPVVTADEVNAASVPRHARATERPQQGAYPLAEDLATMTHAEAITEIGRCLSCGHCNACGTCFVFCPDGAISWDDGPVIDHAFCKGCGICVTECPGHAFVLVNERELANA
jgi:thioredoxin reductase/Pyruvate/2-oxoacid:ferredoxin oxidoreductase delta subunit